MTRTPGRRMAGCGPTLRGVRFVEVVVNGPKSSSLAAALHPDIAAAHDGAQDRAAAQMIGWLVDHATTRIGPRGRQVQVPVQELEAVTVRHHTSRAGYPHRHLHLQVNARVFAEGRWRGLHTVGVRDSLDAINGIGHAAVLTDPAFRAALAAHGFTVDAESGEVVELAGFVGSCSARAAQITRNIDRYEAHWRTTHPGVEPGPRLRRSWDARAWAQARPDKVIPTYGAQLAQRWVEELYGLGYRDPQRKRNVQVSAVRGMSRPVGRVLFTCASRRTLGGHPSGTAVADSLVRSTRELGRAALERSREEPDHWPVPLLDLAPGGVCRAAPVTRSAGGPLHHRFTLAALSAEAGSTAVCSLWHCPAGRPGWVLPTTLPCGARTFLDGSPRRGRPADSSGCSLDEVRARSGRSACPRPPRPDGRVRRCRAAARSPS
jgi:hypothetical protein